MGSTMPIITKPGTITKNSPASFSLSKSSLAAVASVAASPWYSNTSNWKRVVLNYKSTQYNEQLYVTFDATVASPTGTWLAPSICQDVFNIQSISIVDFANGIFRVPSSELNNAEFQVDMSYVPPFYSRNFSSPSAPISGEFLNGSNNISGNLLNLSGLTSGTVYYTSLFSAMSPVITLNPLKTYTVRWFIGSAANNLKVADGNTAPRVLTPTEIAQGYFDMPGYTSANSSFTIYPSSIDGLTDGTVGISKYEVYEI